MISRFLNPQGGPVQGGNDPFGLLQREVNRAFDEVFRGFPAVGRGAAGFGGFAPNLDVRETEQGLEISAELPGMSEADIDLRLDGDLLTLSGEKKDERTQEGGGLHLTERSFGRFQRAFRLPFRPDPGEVQARFDRGVLRVALPRPQQQQSGGRIQIQAGGGGGGGGGGQGSTRVTGVPQQMPGEQQPSRSGGPQTLGGQGEGGEAA
jgi:HSP20 family protein